MHGYKWASGLYAGVIFFSADFWLLTGVSNLVITLIVSFFRIILGGFIFLVVIFMF